MKLDKFNNALVEFAKASAEAIAEAMDLEPKPDFILGVVVGTKMAELQKDGLLNKETIAETKKGVRQWREHFGAT